MSRMLSSNVHSGARQLTVLLLFAEKMHFYSDFIIEIQAAHDAIWH